jgi:hypothetical protein
MHWHLLGKVRAKDIGKFVFAVVLIPREGIRDIVFLSEEPLAVSLDVVIHEEVCMVSSCIDTCFGLDVIVSLFGKKCFSHPLFGVLSVMESAQSSFINLPLIRSIQGKMIAARFSGRFFVAQNRSLLGTLKRHANP